MSQEFNVTSALYELSEAEVIKLPSGGTATVREMTGNEQRNFMNRAKMQSGVAVQELLGACTESFDEQPLPANPEDRQKFLLDLLSGDRHTLVFNIRRHSLGNSFMFSAKCPEPDCGKQSDWEVDLGKDADFPLKPYKLGTQRTVEYESILKPGLKIKFDHLNGHSEMQILRKRNNIHLLSDLELRNPQAWEPSKTVEGEGRWVNIVLNKLPDRLITEMRHVIKDHEGYTDTTVRIICKECASEVVFDLIQQQDFMTPSVTS